MDTQGDCVTLMAAEGIISMSKISSPCQTCQLLHTPTHKTHTQTQSMLGSLRNAHVSRYVFCFILEFSFLSVKWMQWLTGRKKAFVFTRVTIEGPARHSSSLSVRWFTIWLAGAGAGAEKWQHLAPAESFCFLLAPFTDTLCV